MTFYLVHTDSISPTTLRRSDRTEFDARALTMRMFNVGDGDAILLSRGTEGVLFDGGLERRKRNAPLGRALVAFLAQGNITLGALVGTHPHVDHLNALSTVLEGAAPSSLGAEAVYYHNGETMGPWLADTLGTRLEALAASGMLEVQAVPEVLAGRGLQGVQMLHFTDGRWNPKPAYKSIFTRVWYGFASFLFTGDAYIDYEEDLLSGPLRDLLDVDILKITHHGSEHGTGQAFVDAVGSQDCSRVDLPGLKPPAGTSGAKSSRARHRGLRYLHRGGRHHHSHRWPTAGIGRTYWSGIRGSNRDAGVVYGRAMVMARPRCRSCRSSKCPIR